MRSEISVSNMKKNTKSQGSQPSQKNNLMAYFKKNMVIVPNQPDTSAIDDELSENLPSGSNIEVEKLPTENEINAEVAELLTERENNSPNLVEHVASVSDSSIPAKKVAKPVKSIAEKYRESWFVDYAVFINDKSEVECVLCNQVFNSYRTDNMTRHLGRMHKRFLRSFPEPETQQQRNDRHEFLSSELKAKKDAMKKNREIFGLTAAELAHLASFKVAELIAKQKKPYVDGEYVSFKLEYESLAYLLSVFLVLLFN